MKNVCKCLIRVTQRCDDGDWRRVAPENLIYDDRGGSMPSSPSLPPSTVSWYNTRMRACTGADGSVTSTQCDANWLDSVCRAGPVNRPADCLQSRDGITNITILL